ncbi:MAG: T9SS type A sorting domain-containing protein [Saprospiraceae bacterium]|nr:T9SS type A sorting domain-containing protein [Saprospiraceae bacterium]MCF8252139.1 T9SS type A sorting domain-containing protein [Saprospiraceae bacterium]MCF8282452.1 T9SS type A sorting domain-containing protein [Bacteroidales bacterium]MCF8313808.1 T9SS type A sorting domain-containing protein [Saprospiraceae bacterium]MCF8442514.1 T9SS type A sorting domain-containing protein [Saprospiraceae bacterium]
MKFTTLTLFLWLWAIIGLAQNAPTFLNSTAYPVSPPLCGFDNKEEQAAFVLATSDGGQLLVGSFQCGGDDWDGRVIKLNSNGGVVWDKQPGGAGFDVLRSAVEVSDGYFIIGEKQDAATGKALVWLVKYTFAGVFTEQAYANANPALSNTGYTIAKATNNSDLVVGGARWTTGAVPPYGSAPNSEGRVWMFNQSFGVVNSGVASSGYAVLKIEKSSDNSSYYAFGEKYFSNQQDCWTGGGPVWVLTDSPYFPSNGGTFAINYNGYYSDVVVDKFNSSLNMIVNPLYLGGNTPDGFIDGIATPDGGFALLADSYCKSTNGNTGYENIASNFPMNRYWLLKGNASLAVNWKKTVGFGGTGTGHPIVPRGLVNSCDNNYVICFDSYQFSGYSQIIEKHNSNSIIWTTSYLVPNFGGYSKDIEKTADNKYFVAGNYYNSNVDNYDFSLVKWNPDPNCGSTSFCANTTPVSCGTFLPNQSTIGGNNNISSYPCVSNAGFAGPEKVYKITLTQPGDLQIGMEILIPGLDLDLFLLADNCNTVTCLSSSTSSNTTSNLEAIVYPVAAGTYYIVVDGEYATSQGSFSIDFFCKELDCSSVIAPNLTCGVIYSSSTNFSQSNASIYTKPNTSPLQRNSSNTGPERIHRFILPTTGLVNISLTNISSNLELFLLSTCDKDQCIEWSTNAGTLNEQIQVTLTAGTYYVVVDGYNGIFGDYTLKVDWNCCPAPTYNFNCGNIVYIQAGGNSNPLLYTFTSTGQTMAPGYTWQIGTAQSGYQNVAGATNTSVPITFPGPDSYDVCFPYIGSNGCVEYCCRKYCIAAPVNCESSVLYSFNGSQMVFNLQTGGQPSSATWSWDDNPSVQIGTGTQISVPIPSQCTVRTISVRYFDGTCWRICCRKVYLCNPFNCLDFSYNYISTGNPGYQFTLNLSGATNVSWVVDETGASLGTGTQSTILPVPGSCIERTITVRYFWNGAWYICCRKVYLCNPFSCFDFSYNYISTGNPGYQFTLNLSGATNVSWVVDETGASLGTGTQSTILPVPGTCIERTITVRYFWNGAWYICCRKVYLCNPFNCGSITLNYTANQGYIFTLAPSNNNQNISWQVDSPNIIPLGTGSNISQPLPVPAPGSCGFRTVSVRYFDQSCNCWRICCLTFYLCDPVGCSTTITPTYGQNGSTTLQVSPAYQQVQWFDGTNALGSNNPITTTFQPGSSPTIYVRYYDTGSGCYYYCCKTLSVPFNPPPCQLTANYTYVVAGTTVTFTNSSSGSPSYTASAWTFTNGATTLTSTQANPVQALSPGTWNCCLTVSNSSCASQQKCMIVPIPAASSMQFDIADNICGAQGQIIEVPIRVSNFTNVLNFQFSIKLNNTAVGLLTEIIPASNLPGSAIASDDNSSVGSMLWSDGNPLTLADNSVIGTVRIQINGANGQNSTISFTDDPTPVYAEVSVNGASIGVAPIMNNGSACVSTAIQLCGKIKREDDAPIPNVTVTLSGGTSTQTATTDAQGNYCFQNLSAGGNYVLTPKRDINYTNNVNVGDLSKIQRHILNLEPLSTPYKRIAANAKPSNTGINVGDLSEIQRLILGIINDFPEVDSWRFVPKSFVFPNPQNPFASAFPEAITLNAVNSSATDIDFTGVKMGDVTLTNPPGLLGNNVSAVSDGNSVALSFYLDNATVQSGDFVEIPVKTSGFQNMTGVQFSMGWDASKLEFQGIPTMNPTLALQATNFNQATVSQGKLGFTWFNGAGISLPDASTVFTLRFKAVGNTGTTTLAFTDDPTSQYFVDLNDEVQASMSNGTITITFNCGTSGPSSVSVTNNGNGTATAIVQGGTPPYSYQWSNGQNTQTATGLTTGTYTVTATDGNGCSASGSITVGPSLPCSDWVNPSPTTGWINFNQEFGGAPCNDGTGCPFYEISDFSVWASEAYEIEGFIQGGTYAFSMCNGVGAGTWVPDFTIIAPNGNVDKSGLGDGDGCTITWTASQSGTYLIIINEAGHCGGGSNLSTDNGWPAITCISNANCILPCANSMLSLSVVDNGNSTATATPTNGVSPYAYNWSNGQTTQTATNLPTGSYSVTVTDANGCTAVQNIGIVSGSQTIENVLGIEMSPNPSTGKFSISLEMAEAMQVQVAIYDITGRQLLVAEQYGNTLKIPFDLSDRPSGVYLVKMAIGEKMITRRMVITK